MEYFTILSASGQILDVIFIPFSGRKEDNMRNPNGYGSVIKLSGKRRCPYAVRVTVGTQQYTDKNGKIAYRLKYKYIGYYSDRKQAFARLAEYNASKAENPETTQNLISQNIKNRIVPTFSSVYEDWYKRKENSNRNYSDSTFRQYRVGYNRLKELWNLPINLLDYETIQPVLDKYSDKSKSTLTEMRTVLTGVLDHAILKRIITENYAKLCDYNYTETEEKLHKPYSSEDIKLLWQHKDDFLAKLILITIYTGMRPSELLLIENSNVNIAECGIIGGIKSTAGRNRFIPIHKKIMPIIQELVSPENSHLVSIDGKKVSYRKFLDMYKDYCRSLGLDHTPHDGRHTCSTALEEIGVPLLLRQRILGHSSKNVTEQVYTTVDRKRLVEAINKLNFD